MLGQDIAEDSSQIPLMNDTHNTISAHSIAKANAKDKNDNAQDTSSMRLTKPENPSLLEEIIFSTMEEGISPRIQLVIHGIFLFLFITLLGLFIVSQFNLHVLALMFIEIGLWGSVTWVLFELEDAPAVVRKTKSE